MRRGIWMKRWFALVPRWALDPVERWRARFVFSDEGAVCPLELPRGFFGDRDGSEEGALFGFFLSLLWGGLAAADGHAAIGKLNL